MSIDYFNFYKLPSSKRTKLVDLAEKVLKQKAEMMAAGFGSLMM